MHLIIYCKKCTNGHEKNLFGSIKDSTEALDKLKSRGFRAISLSTYDFSTLDTTLPNNLIKKKLKKKINKTTCHREGTLYLACDDIIAFFTSDDRTRFKLWSCQKVCDALIYL